MTTNEVLKKARDLLSDSSRWTWNLWARNKDGAYASPASPDACQWCLTGALYKAILGDCSLASLNESESKLYEDCLAKLRTSLSLMGYPMTGVAEYNDTHSHLEVLKLLDKAIEGA